MLDPNQELETIGEQPAHHLLRSAAYFASRETGWNSVDK
jgi:hypothetical protein